MDITSKQKKIYAITIISLILIAIIVTIIICVNQFSNTNAEAQVDQMSPEQQAAWINEEQRKLNIPLSCDNPMYIDAGSNKLSVNIQNAAEYSCNIQAGEKVFSEDNNYNSTLEAVTSDYIKTYKNDYNIKVVISLKDTSEVIFESNLIKPGSTIEYADINKTLEPGTYQASVEVKIYDNDNNEVRNTNIPIEIICKN